jgi:hypothetical protein
LDRADGSACGLVRGRAAQRLPGRSEHHAAGEHGHRRPGQAGGRERHSDHRNEHLRERSGRDGALVAPVQTAQHAPRVR